MAKLFQVDADKRLKRYRERYARTDTRYAMADWERMQSIRLIMERE